MPMYGCRLCGYGTTVSVLRSPFASAMGCQDVTGRCVSSQYSAADLKLQLVMACAQLPDVCKVDRGPVKTQTCLSQSWKSVELRNIS